MSALLEVRALSRYFKVATGVLHAVDDVSFRIEAGKTLGIVGESGCGKSTLGRTMLRLQEPTAGRIFFDGMDITAFSREEMRQMRRYMQIIFQDPYASLDPRLTIAQSIEEPLKVFFPKMSERERRERIESLMELVGLSRRALNAYPHEFDGGRRQRVVIARALAAEPRFVVCDEPVSALDVSVQAQILNLMMDLQERLHLTYVFISHDLSVVRHISDHVGVMYLGQLVEYADKETLFQAPAHPYTQALLSAIPSVDLDARRERVLLRGEIGSPIDPKPGCRFAPRCGYACPACSAGDVALEQIGSEHYVACTRCGAPS